MRINTMKFPITLALVILALSSSAQRWIPKSITQTTILVEQFKYQDPNRTLESIDDNYEDARDSFIETTNANLENYNTKFSELFKDYKGKYILAIPNKIDEQYPDKNTYRYILRREPFFGNKKVYNSSLNKTDDQSYFAYRYYFYDRVTKQQYEPYYFSGDQWLQVRRIVFWLNQQ